MRFEAVKGKVAFRFDSLVFQSITLPNSTRLPASPADSRIVCRNAEPAVSLDTSSATRAGPFSATRVLGGPLSYAFGGVRSCSQSMFHAGHSCGLAYVIAGRSGAC